MAEAKTEKKSWVARLKARVQRVLTSNKKSKPVKDTSRTKGVSDRLKQAGITDDEINRMRGKK